MKLHERKLIVLSLKWYDQRIHKGVLDYAMGRNWDVMASPHMPQILDIPEADGQIVMIGPKDQRGSRKLQDSLKPTVGLGRWHSQIDLPCVLPDNEACGRLAAEELLGRGFQTFAVFSTQSHWYVDDRRNSFRKCVMEKGFPCETWHLPMSDQEKGSFRQDGSVQRTFEEWFNHFEKPLGLYCSEDEEAAMIMRGCHQLGIAVPEQVALVGTNNDPVICPYTEVPLSSVDLNWEGVGYAAAEQLDLLMQGKKAQPVTLVPPKGLVIRKSSEALAVEDLRVALALSYIEENSHRHVSVSEITENNGIPLRTLQWAFKRALGTSIQDEITKSRTRRVEDMLLNTDRKVGQIAEDLGFSSAQYMNHFFSKAKGVTPNDYRQTYHLPKRNQVNA